MGNHYKQITLEERCEMAYLLTKGHSLRQIAAALDRAPSTVSRELNRNGSATKGYEKDYADLKARARRWQGSMLDRDEVLREEVLDLLKHDWSPQQVSAGLARKHQRPVISYETIYRFVYAQIARKKEYPWRHYLPQARSKRSRRRHKLNGKAPAISQRRPLSERPDTATDRQTPGHWEADLMLFSAYGQALLVVQERHSRLLLAARPAGKSAAPIAELIGDLLAPLPPTWRQTITFDNGTEFARHYHLHALGIETFFCDIRAPWQKGGVENSIGRLRRNLPRKTDLKTLSDEHFTRIIQAHNNTPRKCLGYQTPAEVFRNHVLRFKCECASPPSRE